jgi:hypothetical protein
MEIIKLPAGEQAAADTDCITIGRTADGRYWVMTSALVECGDDDVDEGDSEAVIDSDTYTTFEEAEAAALALASRLCVEKLYVETSG